MGSVRVGVARSDPQGLLAVPEATLRRDANTVAALRAIADEWGIRLVYVGLPLTMAGERGPSAAAAESFADDLARAWPDAEVRLIDERLSTVEASRGLRSAGRSTRASRPVIDQAAAVVILESALAIERATGNPAGRRVTV